MKLAAPTVCSGHYLKHEKLEECCDEPRIRISKFEPIVWGYILNLISNSTDFEKKIRQAQMEEMRAVEPKEGELEHVSALIAQTEKEADDIGRALTKSKGVISQRLEIYAQEIDRRYTALVAKQQELESAVKALILTEPNIVNILEFRIAIEKRLANPTFGDRRLWLEILGTEVLVKGGWATITCRLPVKPYVVPLKGKDKSHLELVPSIACTICENFP